MLCHTCWGMLRRQDGKQWRGTTDLNFSHHQLLRDLYRSKETKCGICRVLFEELEYKIGARVGDVEKADKRTVNVRAFLFIPTPREEQLYCLKFKFHYDQFQCERTFVLREIDPAYPPPSRTPTSGESFCDEVLQRTIQWITQCQCLETDVPRWYPARLISLRRLKESSFGESLESTTSDSGNKVLLVEKCDWESEKPTEYVQYVTLSHCWGKLPEAQQTKLCSANIEEFRRGIKLEDLPKTFSQAMQFAARLPEVGYIWIDSLCIKQGDKEDWLAQSAHMGRIYKEAFLNLSATAATDSQQGLFTGHVPRITIGDEATLNIFGLPGATRASENFLRECAIFDLSIWANRIENAPVNKRGWVLQERLMAPRVLHFCLDRVAWECCEFEAAEGQPEGMLNYQLTLNGIRAGSRLKGLDPLTDGVWLRHMRLRGYHDPDPHLQPGIYTFELWRRIVEVYCKTVLTLPGDKLIALSGLARWMSERIEKTPAAATVRAAVPSEIAVSHTIPSGTTQYVAGMWALHLASQLLWYVEPTFQHDGGGKFEHLTKAPPTTLYRAPSFSWTAIDTDDGNGITYGEVTDQDILITVEEVSVTPRPQSDAFGMLEDAYIVLQVKLRKAVLLKNGSDRFKWKLVDRGFLDQYEHTDVYLDCPARDENEQEKRRIIGPDAGVFVVLGAWTDRKMGRASKYLTCLILQLEKREAGLVFHRIGLTKLSPYGDRKTLNEDEILKKHNDDTDILDGLDYDPLTGMHRIRLI